MLLSTCSCVALQHLDDEQPVEEHGEAMDDGHAGAPEEVGAGGRGRRGYEQPDHGHGDHSARSRNVYASRRHVLVPIFENNTHS